MADLDIRSFSVQVEEEVLTGLLQEENTEDILEDLDQDHVLFHDHGQEDQEVLDLLMEDLRSHMVHNDPDLGHTLPGVVDLIVRDIIQRTLLGVPLLFEPHNVVILMLRKYLLRAQSQERCEVLLNTG